LFGIFSFGCLAYFRLVVWRIFVWSFGIFSFGRLAHFHLVIWRICVDLFGKTKSFDEQSDSTSINTKSYRLFQFHPASINDLVAHVPPQKKRTARGGSLGVVGGATA